MITDPWFYAAAVPAILIAGISKGGFGGGLVVMSVPLLALHMDPRQAAGIMLPLLMCMDLIGLGAYRKHWDSDTKRLLKLLLPAAAFGILLGALSFQFLQAHLVKLLIGLIACGFSLFFWSGGVRAQRRKPGSVSGFFWSAMAGLTSFVAHAGGPPLSVYLLPQRLDKTIFVGVTIIFFAVVNYIKVIPYAILGQLNVGNLTTSLVLSPLAFFGVWLGVRLHHKLSEKWFYQICYVLLFVTGIKLLYDGFLGF